MGKLHRSEGDYPGFRDFCYSKVSERNNKELCYSAWKEEIQPEISSTRFYFTHEGHGNNTLLPLEPEEKEISLHKQRQNQIQLTMERETKEFPSIIENPEKASPKGLFGSF